MKKLWEYSGARFIAVGVFNTIVDFSILNILVFSFGFNKILANSISVTVAMTLSYLLNKSVVFKYEKGHQVGKIAKFIVVTAFGLFVLQNGIIYLLVHKFAFPGNLAITIIHDIGLTGLSHSFISLNIAKALATAVTLIWNYFMYRYVVFVDK
jgi:putative flippase GtrA